MLHQVLEMKYISNIRFAGLAQVGVQPLEDGFQEVQMFVCLRNFGLDDLERLKELKRKVRAVKWAQISVVGSLRGLSSQSTAAGFLIPRQHQCLPALDEERLPHPPQLLLLL